MSSNHIVNGGFGAALMVAIPALGCAFDDEGSAPSEAASGNTDTGTRTLGEGIESLQGGDLREVGREVGQLRTELSLGVAASSAPAWVSDLALSARAAAVDPKEA